METPLSKTQRQKQAGLLEGTIKFNSLNQRQRSSLTELFALVGRQTLNIKSYN